MATINTNIPDSSAINGTDNNSISHDKLVDEASPNEVPGGAKTDDGSLSTASTLLENFHLSDGEHAFSISNLYKFALKFYKDKSGKAIHLSYEDNCKLVALSQQVSQGPFNPASCKTLGVLDVVGRDRRLAWQSLGCLSKEEAMTQFVDTLHKLTPTFKPYVEALWADHLDKENKKKEEEIRKLEEEEEEKKVEEFKKIAEEDKRKQEETKRQIQEALNQQTFQQFKMYAQQQYPGNPEQQAVLIRQLQEQHYQQYMQQVYQQQLLQQQQKHSDSYSGGKNDKHGDANESFTESNNSMRNCETDSEEEVHTDDDEGDGGLNISPASMWTRRDIKEFKDAIKKEGGDSIIKVGHGETVTVRVPTHEDGTCLFWEFATDSYDIGFGVYFEWTKERSNAVSVHISESDDDEEEEDVEDETDDIERLAAGLGKLPDPNKPPQSIIIPVYRRDCHEEVYAGSHSYPGTGVYLLKFDNSYSLWRSKVLYYRVYYTR